MLLVNYGVSYCVHNTPLYLPLAGRNEKGQLGHGDNKRLEAPKLIETLADSVIVSAACGRNHTLALTGLLRVYLVFTSGFNCCMFCI